MVLVDTSVWIEVFRKGTRFQLESVADADDVVTCLPVLQEVLQGFREERAFALARDAMLSFPVVEAPLRTEVILEAAQLYRAARRAGLTIRSGVDCLIASFESRLAACPPLCTQAIIRLFDTPLHRPGERR